MLKQRYFISVFCYAEGMSIDETVLKFEKKLLDALNYKYRNEQMFIKEKMLSVHFVTTFNIEKMLDLYRKSKYPQDRLEKYVYMLMDIKLQMYLIETDLGADNTLMQIITPEKENDGKKAQIELIHLSFNQSLIFKSRALWERVMNLVYYLEKGKEINAKSKKTKFFSFINNEEDESAIKWKFLSDYEDYVKWFDDAWRTPEAHGGSTLRASFSGTEMSNDDVNKILGLNDIVANVFYVNLADIINGDKPSRWFWTYGMGQDKLSSVSADT